MSDGIYPTLGRQTGLLREMSMIAQNIANASTTGYRAGGMIFSEFIVDTGRDNPSVSMANGNSETTHLAQGGLDGTGGALDLAIEGEGFFLVESDGAPHLTRAGAFLAGPAGGVQSPEGHALLDEGGAPIFVPPGATDLFVGSDGTLSAGGEPIARVAIVRPADGVRLDRAAGTLFDVGEAYEPVEVPRVLQGFLEASNVDPVLEIARMVTVQNAYELGQSFMEREDQRVRAIFRLMEQ
ncbi:MAG: flagellar hook-basal body complex protein [Jannaschia sp.]